MKLDYKKELERAAHSMILVHKPETLIKLIARTIVQKVQVAHAGILLYNKKKDTYLFTESRGALGMKIPAGLIRLDRDNPLIALYANGMDKRISENGALTIQRLTALVADTSCADIQPQLLQVKAQMENLGADTCIPSYYRNELIGILILGRKADDEEFQEEEIDFFQALSSDVTMAIRNAQLFEELQDRAEREHQLFIKTVMALAGAIDAKDHYTHGHTERVIDYSMLIAEHLNKKRIANLDVDFVENLRVASLLHDIGKIGISEAVLNKNSKLSDEEFKLIQQHTIMGVRILEPIKDLLKDAFDGIKYHHERYDGSGYPEQLQGDAIPIIAAIIGVADAFDAMTSDRPYRKALSMKEAIEQITKNTGTQFHPIVGQCMTELYEEGKL